jgi:hypothetical protein
VAEVAGRKVHDRPTEVGTEGTRVAEVPQLADQPRERLLDEILGQGSIARQQEREPNALRRVPDVEVAQRAVLKGVFRRHGDGHHVAFYPHGIETRSYPRNAAPAARKGSGGAYRAIRDELDRRLAVRRGLPVAQSRQKAVTQWLSGRGGVPLMHGATSEHYQHDRRHCHQRQISRCRGYAQS